MFDRIADITWRHPRAVLAGVGLFFIFSMVVGSNVEEHLQPAGFSDPDSESVIATDVLRNQLGYDASPGIVTLIENPDGGKINIAAKDVRREAKRISKQLLEARHVSKVVNPLDRLGRAIRKADDARQARDEALVQIEAQIDAQAAQAQAAQAQAAAGGAPIPESALRRTSVEPPDPRSQLPRELRNIPTNEELVEQFREEDPQVAKDGRSFLISGHLETDDPEAEGGEAAEDARELLDSELLKIGLSGFVVGFDEVESQTREDLTKAELIAFPILGLLLLLVFRGVVAAAIPLVVGAVSIVGTFMVMRLMSEFVDVSLFALNITTALSLGLAVDYGLLMVSRYREEIFEGGATREAHQRTISTAGRTVLFSGVTVAAALFALIIFPQRFLYSVGAAGAAVGLLASIISILTVGALLSLLGERINALGIRKADPSKEGVDGWFRLARGVMKRPIMVAVSSSVLLIALAVPLAFTELTGPSSEAVPPSQPSFKVFEDIKADYPPQVVEPALVTVRGKANGGELREFSKRIRNIQGIIKAGGQFVEARKRISYASFGFRRDPTKSVSQEAVETLRDLEPPGGTEILVSGNAAAFLDQKESMVKYAPRVMVVVALITLLILFLLTGSIILPLKTLLMNMLTMGATLGILVLGFQVGLLRGLTGYTGPEAVELMTLLLVFAISFGLATDYAVLVMARIKENHDKGMPNEEAVVHGIARTGRVISAAALMLAVVFIAFATSSVFFMKQAAIGQAAGVLIDATIVRALLVPSLMKLFGEANWWAPGPMRRFQERFGFHEG